MAASINFRNGFVNVTYNVASYKEEDGTYTCEIPAFKINFFAQNKEEVEQKSKFMIKSFFNYYKVKGFKSNKLLMDINKLGFKAPQHNLVMFNALKKHVNPNATFSREETPSEGLELQEYNLESELV